MARNIHILSDFGNWQSLGCQNSFCTKLVPIRWVLAAGYHRKELDDMAWVKQEDKSVQTIPLQPVYCFGYQQ